jgi:hypothetical protein
VRLLFHEIGYPYAVNFPVSDDYLLAWMQAADGAGATVKKHVAIR